MSAQLPPHGYIGCRKCFTGEVKQFQFSNFDGSRWQLEQPNATWGSTRPEVMVLGFSRGATQSKPGIPFDEIAFKGMRGSLTLILQALGLLGSESIAEHIRAESNKFGFGSLIRCSVAQWDTKKSSFAKSGGAILKKFAQGDQTHAIAANCSSQYLGTLPERTKLIVMLSNDEAYVKFCFELMSHTRGETTWVNPVSYDSAGVRFVHTIHAKAQGSYIPDWLAGIKSQAQKRLWADEAVAPFLPDGRL